MEVLIRNISGLSFPEHLEDVIRKAISETLEYERLHDNVEVSVSIVSNKEIQSINYDFRNIDMPTDVLSFPLLEADKVKRAFKKNDTVFLGDVVISIEKAQSQANELGHNIKREIAFLTVHSMLHLLGYDHVKNKEDEKNMFLKQDEILLKAGFNRI